MSFSIDSMAKIGEVLKVAVIPKHAMDKYDRDWNIAVAHSHQLNKNLFVRLMIATLLRTLHQ